MFLTDNDRKKISIKTKKIIEETLKKNKKVNNKKLFDIWSSIALQSEIDYENVNFIELNKPWGFNYSKITAYFYNKFITNFNDRNFEKKIYDLLNQSKTKTPQLKKGDRKIPFEQTVFKDEMNEGDWYSPTGEDSEYSNSEKEQNPYHTSYCRKTKIPFFKGPKDQEEFIISKKWENLYSNAFVYGYLLSSINYILINWKIVRKDTKRVDYFGDRNCKVKLFKDQKKIEKYNELFFKELYVKFIKENLKNDHEEADKIYSMIFNSIYNSRLTTYLIVKKDSYFTIKERKIVRQLKNKYEQEGTSEFMSEILSNKKKYLANSNDKRFYNTILNSRTDSIKNKIYGQLYNFEQFLLYTMSIQYIAPLDHKKLNIEEKDIFIRFAINRGMDEFLSYAHGKIY